MKDKQLKDKAIDIKGKKYVLVSDRINFFNENYLKGSIITQLVSDSQAEMVVIKAKVTPDISNQDRYFTGYSQARWGDGYINKTSALENCETSAVGRALGMMGIGVIDSVASVDELAKAQVKPERPKPDGLKARCKVHNIEMKQAWSEKKQDYYWYHRNDEGQICFGKGYKK